MRGEKLTVGFFPPLPWGSPPHARGKVCMFFKRTINAGITPACAGKSCDIVNQSIDLGDHPRMRGEKDRWLRTVWVREGSPPHARGKVDKAVWAVLAAGITPACAGKSPYPWPLTGRP